MKKTLKIDIVSDLVCPWCYIGQKRLNDALKQTDYEVEISWKPFQLHPELEKDGVEKEAFMLKKFGSNGEHMFDQVKSVANSESLEMNPELIKNIPNTIDVHRLMWFARKQQKDQELAKKLFEGYFADGKDFSKTETLIELGEACGLLKDDIIAFLASEEGKAEVLKEEQKYRKAGIKAVPSFIINDKYMIQGAQPIAIFLDAFKQMDIDAENQFLCTGEDC